MSSFAKPFLAVLAVVLSTGMHPNPSATPRPAPAEPLPIQLDRDYPLMLSEDGGNRMMDLLDRPALDQWGSQTDTQLSMGDGFLLCVRPTSPTDPVDGGDVNPVGSGDAEAEWDNEIQGDRYMCRAS